MKWVQEKGLVGNDHGQIVRTMRDPETRAFRPERWDPASRTWIEMPQSTIEAVDMAPPARPELLTRLGVPESDWRGTQE